MYISLDWISDYVDLADLSPKEIAERLTLATAEVEGFETLERSVAGVLVGEIVSAEPIVGKDGKRLVFCAVDCGEKTFTTVCGAPNARVGLKAPFAPAGTRLAGGVTIQATELAGRASQGILCSAAELGMSRWHEALLECPASIKPGTPLSDFVPATDVLIEIDNKSLTHRPDLWGHYGFARELAAVFRRDLIPLGVVRLENYDHLPPYDLTVDDRDGCPCYTCIEFDLRAAQPAPLVVQRRLHALGQRTFSLMVDLTNYCMLEIGQPTHAFDGSRLKAVRVATLGEPGTFTTLDGQQRKLLADDLLIWNESEPVALAGIMGGENSEVGPDTTKVLLESANFKAAKVRRTSVRLDLRTDAVQRFEKSQPPSNTKTAVARILQLLTDAGADPNVTRRFTVVGDLRDTYRVISLPAGQLDRMAGVELPRAEVQSILQSLGFTSKFQECGALQVGVPPHRSEKDISIAPDIAEEVLRIHGYGRITPVMPSMPLKPLHVEESIRQEHKSRRVLATAHRFIEVHNYGWTDDAWLARIGFEPGETINLRNPASQTCRRMRTTLLPTLLSLVGKNRTHRDAFRLFELGHVYLPAGKNACDERTRLAGVSYQSSPTPSIEDHFCQIKGALRDVQRVVGGEPMTFTPSGETRTPWQTAGHWVEIRQADRTVGSLGVADSRLLASVVPEGGQLVWFELAMDQLHGALYPVVRYASPPKFPGSWQDFSLVWPVQRGYADLAACLDAFEHPLVMRREFLIAYKGKGLEKGFGSYSFRYWLGARDHTLSTDEIDDFRNSFLDFLNQHDIPLR